MMQCVTDTHGLCWHLSDDPRLSPTARQIFQGADRGVNQIVVPGITLVEMIYLVERNRIVRAHVEQLFAILQSNPKNYVVSALDLNTARAISFVPRTRVPDMPDRIITATALQLGVTLITRDTAIHKAGIVPVIW